MKDSEFVKKSVELSKEAENLQPDDPNPVESISIQYEGANKDGTTKRWTTKHPMRPSNREIDATEE